MCPTVTRGRSRPSTEGARRPLLMPPLDGLRPGRRDGYVGFVVFRHDRIFSTGNSRGSEADRHDGAKGREETAAPEVGCTLAGSPPRHTSREQLTCRHGSVRVAPRANPCHARPYGRVARLEKVERGQRRRSSAEHEGNDATRQRVAQLHVGKASGRTTYARRMPAERAERFHLLPRGGIPHSATRGVQRVCGALRFEGLGHGPKKQACWLVFPRTGRAQALSARRAPVVRASGARCIATYVQPTTQGGHPPFCNPGGSKGLWGVTF